jgi:hypothetical protein
MKGRNICFKKTHLEFWNSPSHSGRGVGEGHICRSITLLEKEF